jgi:hydrogenase maturation factor
MLKIALKSANLESKRLVFSLIFFYSVTQVFEFDLERMDLKLVFFSIGFPSRHFLGKDALS